MLHQMQRNETAASNLFVISRTDEGFRVYSPAEPNISYTVSGSPEAPSCTCPEYQYHEGDANWRCSHILAVLNQFSPTPQNQSPADQYEVAERLAIQAEGQPSRPAATLVKHNGHSQMLIKRSVSPDGRIDSLSVEFSHPVDQESVHEIKDKAFKSLRLQSDIVASFLNGRRKPDISQNNHRPPPAAGAVSAVMVDVGGMNGKWGGRRLFINVQANGQMFKLFGTKKQLSEYLTAAGYWNMAERIDEGVLLNLPCRITTRPSPDGKFINVDRLLPIDNNQPGRSS